MTSKEKIPVHSPKTLVCKNVITSNQTDSKKKIVTLLIITGNQSLCAVPKKKFLKHFFLNNCNKISVDILDSRQTLTTNIVNSHSLSTAMRKKKEGKTFSENITYNQELYHENRKKFGEKRSKRSVQYKTVSSVSTLGFFPHVSQNYQNSENN